MGREKQTMKKATLEALMERAAQASEQKIQYGEFESEELGMKIPFRRIKAEKYARIIDESETRGGGDSERGLELAKETIYEAVPLFHDQKLLDAYRVVEPTDIVTRIFNDNMGEIMRFTEAITAKSGIDADDLKN